MGHCGARMQVRTQAHSPLATGTKLVCTAHKHCSHEITPTTLAKPCSSTPYALMWLAHTLSVLSRRITRRTFLVSLCARTRTSPVPRSFHSRSSLWKRKSFARLVCQFGDGKEIVAKEVPRAGRWEAAGERLSDRCTMRQASDCKRAVKTPCASTVRQSKSRLAAAHGCPMAFPAAARRCTTKQQPTLPVATLAPSTCPLGAVTRRRRTVTHILNSTSSSSSCVLASTVSVRRITGSNWGSCSSPVSCCSLSASPCTLVQVDWTYGLGLSVGHCWGSVRRQLLVWRVATVPAVRPMPRALRADGREHSGG